MRQQTIMRNNFYVTLYLRKALGGNIMDQYLGLKGVL